MMFTVSITTQVNVGAEQLADQTNSDDLIQLIRDTLRNKCRDGFYEELILCLCKDMCDSYTDRTEFIGKVRQSLEVY